MDRASLAQVLLGRGVQESKILFLCLIAAPSGIIAVGDGWGGVGDDDGWWGMGPAGAALGLGRPVPPVVVGAPGVIM